MSDYNRSEQLKELHNKRKAITQEKVDKLYDIMADKTNVTGADYASITNRELTINTKGCFPTKV